MSSMRNAVSRRPHRERAQPAARSKWGLLEKHKDYSLRAKDYNVKKQKLSQLSVKARDRHPDEFAYGMLSKDKSRQGKHGRGGDENVLAHDAVKLLKSQDAGYLRVVLGRGRKEIRTVEEEVGLDRPAGGKKILFGNDGNASGEKRNAERNTLQDLDLNETVMADASVEEDDDDIEEPPQTVAAPKPTSKKALEKQQDAASRLKAARKKRRRLQDMRVAKLETLKKRQKEIMAVADRLELQRAKMARTVGGMNKNGVKFKIRERKQ